MNNENQKKSIFEEENIEFLDFDLDDKKNSNPIPKEEKKDELVMPPSIEGSQPSIHERINPINENLNTISLEKKLEEERKAEAYRKSLEQKRNGSLLNRPITYNELLGDYVGDNYYKISERFYNLSAMIFGPLYLFYRKMFLFGLGLSIVIILMLTFISNKYFAIIPCIIVGFIFNPIYMAKAGKAIERNRKKNRSDTYNLKEMCTKSGGTSLGLVFVGIILIYGIVFGLVEYNVLPKFTRMIEKNNINLNLVENVKKFIEDLKGDNSNNILKMDRKVVISDEFDITIPKAFEEDADHNTYMYHYVYSSTNFGYNVCSFKLYSVANRSNPEEFLNEIGKINNSTRATLDGNWYFTEYKTEGSKVYNYSLNKNGKLYYIIFENQTNSPDDCDTYIKEIFTSIKIK